MRAAIKTKQSDSIISDHMARQLIKMAEKFYSDPKNVQGYFEEYRCLPGCKKGEETNERK